MRERRRRTRTGTERLSFLRRDIVGVSPWTIATLVLVVIGAAVLVVAVCW